jgi:hypothetical protein
MRQIIDFGDAVKARQEAPKGVWSRMHVTLPAPRRESSAVLALRCARAGIQITPAPRAFGGGLTA